MGRINKKHKNEHKKNDPPNQRILDLIGSPNSWTPKIEDMWLKELNKLSVIEIYKKFKPLKKPPSVKKRGRNNAWR